MRGTKFQKKRTGKCWFCKISNLKKSKLEEEEEEEVEGAALAL